MKPTVLVTAIGTMASTTIVKQLRKTGCYYLIGADIYQREWVATGGEVDEFYVFPPAVKDFQAYIDFAVSFCKMHDVRYYYATIDEEIANLSKNRIKFEEAGVKLCIPNHDLVMTCHYKDVFSRWIITHMPQIAIKTYFKGECIPDDAFPLFVKPIEGRASIGCMRIDTPKALATAFDGECRSQDFLIQECVEGEIITVDLIRNAATGQHTQIQRREILRNSNGCGIAVQVIHDDALTEICNVLMEKLDLDGVVNAEFFSSDRGYRIIEVNPRFSAGVSYSCLAGCDVVNNALAIASRKPCLFGSIKVGRHFAKRYETVQTD